jgi:3-hydroxybutyryl-CoA dehydratase
MAAETGLDPNESVPQKFHDEFPVGLSIRTQDRTVTADDIAAFATLSGDHYPLHTDPAYAATTRFGGIVAHGPLIFSIGTGLLVGSGFFGDAVVAFLEVTRLVSKKPVFPGDTLHMRAEVVQSHLTEGGRHGVLEVECRLFDQHDDNVMSFGESVLTKLRPS